MPEYRITVNLAVRDYPDEYGTPRESSTHQFFFEAESAAIAATRAREQFLSTPKFVTVDVHDRIRAELSKVQA